MSTTEVLDKRTKLTAEQVAEIRARRKGRETLVALAQAYNVDPSTIWKIVNRRTRKHV